ncbi:hypothetical protein JCGZ_15111 [Jatropha curcas]|uniref:Uncharacterized protein n=1 Tax=Jatropha curcas TaxID=180498 RepID=A0A067L9Y3_JATCU|nr:hypothetical protein JCGZ_15111 [Jatropha curcas]
MARLASEPSGRAPGAPHGRSAARDSMPVTEWYQSRLALHQCPAVHSMMHNSRASVKSIALCFVSSWCQSNGGVLGTIAPRDVRAMAEP